MGSNLKIIKNHHKTRTISAEHIEILNEIAPAGSRFLGQVSCRISYGRSLCEYFVLIHYIETYAIVLKLMLFLLLLIAFPVYFPLTNPDPLFWILSMFYTEDGRWFSWLCLFDALP